MSGILNCDLIVCSCSACLPVKYSPINALRQFLLYIPFHYIEEIKRELPRVVLHVQ